MIRSRLERPSPFQHFQGRLYSINGADEALGAAPDLSSIFQGLTRVAGGAFYRAYIKPQILEIFFRAALRFVEKSSSSSPAGIPHIPVIVHGSDIALVTSLVD